MTVDALFQWVHGIEGIEGVSISGGEPTEQMPGLVAFLERIRAETDLSVLLFSGRTMREITGLSQGKRLVSLLDVLIDGHYDPARANPPGIWPSSANQTIHLIGQRYATADFKELPALEIIITGKGEVIQSGLGIALSGAREFIDIPPYQANTYTFL